MRDEVPPGVHGLDADDVLVGDVEQHGDLAGDGEAQHVEHGARALSVPWAEQLIRDGVHGGARPKEIVEAEDTAALCLRRVDLIKAADLLLPPPDRSRS
jgi:hypothetical protein